MTWCFKHKSILYRNLCRPRLMSHRRLYTGLGWDDMEVSGRGYALLGAPSVLIIGCVFNHIWSSAKYIVHSIAGVCGSFLSKYKPPSNHIYWTGRIIAKIWCASLYHKIDHEIYSEQIKICHGEGNPIEIDPDRFCIDQVKADSATFSEE